MSMFTLGISCLTTSYLPWFMDLTFQVPMQYCSLQHWTLLPSPVTSTIGCCFCFGPVSSFFLEVVLHWSPVAYWVSTDLGNSSFSILSFCLFILFMGFSRQEYWSGFPFPSPVDHILSEFEDCCYFSRVRLWSGFPFPPPMLESEKWKWSRSVVSDSSRPHRWQPTRLPHPWDSPGKSTGVGCHCLLRVWDYGDSK